MVSSQKLLPMLILLFVPCFLLQFATAGPSKDLISSLPGQPSVSFSQYAGYVPVDLDSGRSFFYYFVEAQTDASSRPLSLWLNGGPGCSSVGYGAMMENGPFHPNSESGALTQNEYSWNKVSNMLYVDSPAGVGWSYSNTSSDLSTNDAATARDNLAFLLNWFEAFPEYQGRELFISGESYAGHYAPQLAGLILDYIEEAGTSIINFVGLAIGNPLLNSVIDFEESVVFQRTHALISDETSEAVIANCNFSIVAINSGACNIALAELDREVSSFTDPYNILLDVCVSSMAHQSRRLQRFRKRHRKLGSSSGSVDVCIEDEIMVYMNLRSVQQAFHANTTSLPYRWSSCDEGIVDYDVSAFDDSMLPVLTRILEAGVSVLVFSGDEDSVVPFGGTRKQIRELAKIVNLTTSVPYSAWFDGGQVGGWTQSYGPLTYATVRGASHEVPYSNPARALTMFTSFLGGLTMPVEMQWSASATL